MCDPFLVYSPWTKLSMTSWIVEKEPGVNNSVKWVNWARFTKPFQGSPLLSHLLLEQEFSSLTCFLLTLGLLITPSVTSLIEFFFLREHLLGSGSFDSFRAHSPVPRTGLSSLGFVWTSTELLVRPQNFDLFSYSL